MTALEAKRITKKGYRFAITGLIIGFGFSFSRGSIVIPIWAYFLWSLFHGVQIMRPIIERIYDFGPVHLRVTTIPQLFLKSFQLKSIGFLVLIAGGFIVGIFGGAFIRQIYLWVVANN